MFFYNFGLEGYLGLALYVAGMVCMLLSLWKPQIGLFYLIPLLPLQTTRYRMDRYPKGGSLVTLILLTVSLGLLFRRRGMFLKTPWSVLLVIYAAYQFLTLVMGIAYLPPMPSDWTLWRFADWFDYIEMPLLLLVVAGAIASRRDMKIVLVLMCLSILSVDKSFWSAVKDRDYSSYSDDMREAGPLGQAGANGLGAFESQAAVFLIVLAGFQEKRLWRWALYGTGAFSAVCLMYSFSRGGYIALGAGLIFIGLVRQRKLLALMLLFGLAWSSLVPAAVKDRIAGTEVADGELDHSSEMRIVLWQDAFQALASQSPFFGTGYNTYLFLGRVTGFFGAYRDTHDIYLKVLVETGAIGLALFLWLLCKTFLLALKLYRRSADPFFASLGLGLAAWVVCSAVSNLFGDRWTYLQVNGFMWVLGGLVTRAFMLEDETSDEEEPAILAESLTPRMLEAELT